ncbi:MAG: LPP20 family lipoprotein [Elusimicrobiales bacterium]|nr:LPP20 family lipoprotein [Elusimicrobiales bacterium]
MKKESNVRIFAAALAVSAVALLAACGGKSEVVSTGPIAAQAPEWVNKGGQAFAGKETGKYFYGVGMVSGVQNRSLAVTSADQRARAEIAKSLNNYVAVLTKDYMASTTAGAMDKSSEEQHISSTLKGFTQMTLNGAVIVDHWRDPSDGTMFALAKLDMAAVQQTLSDAKELDARVRDYVRANADKAFDELSAAEQQKR